MKNFDCGYEKDILWFFLKNILETEISYFLAMIRYLKMVFGRVSGEIVNFENLVDLKKLKQLDETQSSAHRDFVISFKYFKKKKPKFLLSAKCLQINQIF